MPIMFNAGAEPADKVVTPIVVDQSHDGPVVYFWSDAKYEDVKALAQNAAPGLPFLTSPNITKPADGSVIIAMGNEKMKQLQVLGCAAKNRGIDSLRGEVLKYQGIPVFMTYALGMRHIVADAYSKIIWDTRLAARYMTTGSLRPVVGQYKWADDLSEFIAEIEAMYAATGEPVDVATDTETMGLNPWDPSKHIVTIQCSHTPGTAIAVYMLGRTGADLRQLLVQLKWLLNTPKIKHKGANFKYDLVWIWAKFRIECTNFTMDTTVVGSILCENRSNSLKNHIAEKTDMGGYETIFESKYDKGEMDKVPWFDDPEAIVYAGGDADGCLQVSHVLRKELSQELGLQHLYVNIIHPALRAWEKIERRGIPVDTQKYAELRHELSSYIDAKERSMLGMISPRLRAQHAEKIAERLAEGKAPMTPAMMGQHFFDPHYGLGLKPRMLTDKKKEPSTANEHLRMFYDTEGVKAFVETMAEVGTARKMKSTYVDGFLKHLRHDGCFHPVYMLFKGALFDNVDDDEEGGAVTGRTSAQDPAWQTTPMHNPLWAMKLRSCFPARPGKKYWSRDFRQGELKINACLANEQRMISVYTPGSEMNKLTKGDLHALTGSKFAELGVVEFLAKEYVEKDFFKKYRQYGKHGNFGMLYGISPPGFQAYAWRKGILLTLQQATKYLDDFFDLYPGLRLYHANQRSAAKKNGQVVSPLFRIRHLPLVNSPSGEVRGHTERQAINSPTQSTLSDLCAWAIARIEDELGEEAGINGMIHDSIHGMVDEDKAATIIPQIGQIMDNLPYREVFGWDPPLTFDSDAGWGKSLGEMDKFVEAV